MSAEPPRDPTPAPDSTVIAAPEPAADANAAAVPPPPPYRRPLNLLAYPYFSLEERERRWQHTRQAMADRNVDCVVVPNHSGHSAHLQGPARYLTHVGGGDADVAVVFPLDGEPTAVVTNRDRWVGTQPWCQELREAEGSYGAAVLARLRELDPPARRIGIVGLADSVGAPEGTAGYGFLSLLMRELPNVEWVDFTAELEEIRLVKSAEEVAFLERSMRIVNGAYYAVIDVLRPGVMDQYVWGTVVETIARLGSELPVRLRWIGDHRPIQMLARPTFRAVEEGWLFLTEIEAAWGGYRAQGVQPFACGQSDEVYHDLAVYLFDVWNETFAQVAPGLPVTALQENVARAATRFRPRGGPAAAAAISLVMRGSGLGADAPLVARSGARARELTRVVSPGWCFAYVPTLAAGPYRLAWGDTVVITDDGARRLGRARQEIMVASW